MFKIAAYAAAATVAFAAVPVSAAQVIYLNGNDTPLANQANPTFTVNYQSATNSYDASYKFRVTNTVAGDPNGNFTATYTFSSPIVGLGSAITSSVIVKSNLGSDLDFSQAFLNGTKGDVSNFGNASQAFVFDAAVLKGTNTLSFSGVLNPKGDRRGNALATGSLTIAAVPEPATWGLFILGFGAIGGAMRRRSSNARNTKAALNFA